MLYEWIDSHSSVEQVEYAVLLWRFFSLAFHAIHQLRGNKSCVALDQGHVLQAATKQSRRVLVVDRPAAIFVQPDLSCAAIFISGWVLRQTRDSMRRTNKEQRMCVDTSCGLFHAQDYKLRRWNFFFKHFFHAFCLGRFSTLQRQYDIYVVDIFVERYEWNTVSKWIAVSPHAWELKLINHMKPVTEGLSLISVREGETVYVCVCVCVCCVFFYI